VWEDQKKKGVVRKNNNTPPHVIMMMSTESPSSTKVLYAVVGATVAVLLFVLLSYILMLCYNFAVVKGMSKDPSDSGKPRLSKIKIEHALVLNILIALFLSPVAAAGGVAMARD